MSVRSLAVDRNDQAKLRHGREVNEGIVVMNGEFSQYCPYFFTREGAPIQLVGNYRGAAAFLIAGGPSFAEMDKAPLKSVWTMTLNNSTASFRSNANVIVDDPARFSYSTWLDPLIQKFVPMSHFEKPMWDNRLLGEGDEASQRWEKAAIKVGDCPNVVGYRRNEKFMARRFLQEDTINWGMHGKWGGGRSVLLASLRILHLLGFRRVYLLGVDFEMSDEKRYHFQEERTAAAIQGNMSTYAKLQGWLAELQPYFLKAGYVVKNCNPTSCLKAFPFMPYEEAIAEATGHLGNYAMERTAGMYRKMQDKLAEIGQAQPETASTDGTPSPTVENAASEDAPAPQ